MTLTVYALPAQTPRNITTNGRLDLGESSLIKMACNEAGTITFGTHIGQSNDVDPDTIFLCFGDTLPIIHNGDFDLSGDPNPLTPPGVGYAFYDCPPTVDGMDIASILADPCVNNTSPIIINGMPVPQTNGIWIAGENPNGNVTLINNGALQEAFNGGTAAPVQFWFAPITIDNFALFGYENDGMGGPVGPCVDVNVDEAFSVVYLNAITVADINTNTGSNGCGGSFSVSGGLPEFIPGVTYSVSITLNSDPDITGAFTTSPVHGGTLDFVVPQPGLYDIVVEDGKSCSASFQVNMDACQAVTFSLPLLNAMPGENVCLPVTVEGFNDVASMQFSVSWDPTVLQFTTVQSFNPSVPDLNSGLFNTGQAGSGILTFSWADFSFTGVTLADGSAIFEICFNVIGDFGESSPVAFVNSPTPIEIGDPNQNYYGFVGNDGIVNVSSDVLFVNISQDSVSCPTFSDGAFTVMVAGGTPPYLMSWRPLPPPAGPFNGPETIAASGGSFTVSDLASDFYEILVEDSGSPNPNSVLDTIEVLAGPALGVNIQPVGPACFGESTGSVSAVVILGGVVQPDPGPDFTFTWNTTPENIQTLSNVPSGFYAVTVTDANGCESTASVTLSQPSQLNILPNNTFITNASCSGSMDGAITITATGGTTATGQYTYSWSDGLGTVVATSSQVSNLNPGQYCVTLTDDNDCELVRCFNVGAQKVLSVNAIVADVSCNGLSDGQIVATGSTSGAPADLPYTFTWSSFTTPPVNTPTSSTLNDLPAGTYFLTMTDADAAGCQILDTFIVRQPEALLLSLIEQVNETCVVGNDGSATVGVTGGTYPYTYSWDDPAMQADSIATGLSEGNYTLMVTDANNCVQSLSVSILAPTPPTILPIDDDAVSCPNDTDGTLTVNATPGGAAIAGYLWSNGGLSQTISNLGPGTYFVTVTAEDGCTAIDSAQVTSPDPVTLDSIAVRSPDCPGFNNGQITVFAIGGTAPYRYIWSTNPNDTTTINPLPGLVAGSYSVTVIDANNCAPLVVPVTVNDPPTIVADFSDILGVSCPDDNACDGQATVEVSYSDGSAGVFNVTWDSSGETDNGVTISTANQLCRGEQTVTINDGVCGIIETIDIPSPPDIVIQVMTNPVSCNGLSDGTITLTPSGGTGPFTFLWPATGETTPTIEGLAVGEYTAVITDANGCSRTQTVEISEPDVLVLSIDPGLTTPSVSCNGDEDGIIAVVYNSNDNINPVGNNPFTWSGNVAPSSSSVANNLPAGSYSVTITDTKGCMSFVDFTITEPSPIVAVIQDPVPPLCFGDPTQIIIDTIYGGNGQMLLDYTFMIDNNGLNFPPDQPATVFAGTHIVTVMDIDGCTYEETVEITQPAQIQVNFSPPRVVVELGDSTQILQPIIISTLPIESFQWTPSDALSADNVQTPRITTELFGNQEYTLNVMDINGCVGMGSVFVELDANRNIYIPNVFSPNGDGPNDEFRIFACTGVTAIKDVKIFDRWGELVFQADSLAPDCFGGTRLWDGRLNGRNMNPGVYVYLIEVEFLDRVTLLYRGDVTILR